MIPFKVSPSESAVSFLTRGESATKRPRGAPGDFFGPEKIPTSLIYQTLFPSSQHPGEIVVGACHEFSFPWRSFLSHRALSSSPFLLCPAAHHFCRDFSFFSHRKPSFSRIGRQNFGWETATNSGFSPPANSQPTSLDFVLFLWCAHFLPSFMPPGPPGHSAPLHSRPSPSSAFFPPTSGLIFPFPPGAVTQAFGR